MGVEGVGLLSQFLFNKCKDSKVSWDSALKKRKKRDFFLGARRWGFECQVVVYCEESASCRTKKDSLNISLNILGHFLSELARVFRNVCSGRKRPLERLGKLRLPVMA
jgi:hypothetical protein